MALSRVKTWTSEVLTSSDLNAEFNNILNNAISLISPLTANLAAGGNDITGVDEIELSSGGDASAAGRLRRSTKALTWHDGSAARVVPMILDRLVATATVSNTTTETTVYSFSVPANTIITNRRLRLSLDGVYVNNSAADRNLTVKVKFGASTAATFDVNSLDANASDRYYALDAQITAFNATNSQDIRSELVITGAGSNQVATDANVSPAHYLQLSTTSIDTTSAATLAVTVTHSAAHANLSITIRTACLEHL